MIIQNDWDAHTEVTTSIKPIPDKVDSIQFTHDGGRISISINGVEVYHTALGTRDCCILLDNN